MTDVDAIRAAVAGGWCVPPNTTKEMDVELGEAIVQAMIPVVAAARAEGMREAASIARRETAPPPQHNAKDMWRAEIGAEVSAAILAAEAAQ